jgi:hypothetical protein
MAISDAAKKPLAKIKTNISAASNQAFPISIWSVSYFSAVVTTEETAAVFSDFTKSM